MIIDDINNEPQISSESDDNITPISKSQERRLSDQKTQTLPPDIEYDELHHYEKPAELEQPKQEVPKGHILIDDMTIEQLRNCVRNLADNQVKMEGYIKNVEATNKDYVSRAREIEKRLCDKKWVKARYENLRDHPEAKGVRKQ